MESLAIYCFLVEGSNIETKNYVGLIQTSA